MKNKKKPLQLRWLGIESDILYYITITSIAVFLYSKGLYLTTAVLAWYLGYLLEDYFWVGTADWFKRTDAHTIRILIRIEILLDIIKNIYTIFLVIWMIVQVISKGSLTIDTVVAVVIRLMLDA